MSPRRQRLYRPNPLPLIELSEGRLYELDTSFDEVSYLDIFEELPSKPEPADGWDLSF